MASYRKAFIGGIWSVTFQATWPLAQLIVMPDLIEIKILGHSKYSFKPEKVIGFKKHKRTIQIYHSIPEYPSFIMFGIMGNSNKILTAIEASGFTPQGHGIMDDSEYETNRMIVFVGIAFLVMTKVSQLN